VAPITLGSDGPSVSNPASDMDAQREGIALARCDIGVARSLPGADGSADVVLLLGPLLSSSGAPARR
jgi:hypothetical protein